MQTRQVQLSWVHVFDNALWITLMSITAIRPFRNIADVVHLPAPCTPTQAAMALSLAWTRLWRRRDVLVDQNLIPRGR
jgi:hypothetical protein